jgi:hypothetical protein
MGGRNFFSLLIKIKRTFWSPSSGRRSRIETTVLGKNKHMAADYQRNALLNNWN